MKWNEKPPRVEILYRSRGDNRRGKLFGYVRGVNTTGGMHFFDQSRASEPGEAAFLVGRSPTSGALWYSYKALRFTKPPRSEVSALSDEERVALDLLLASGPGHVNGQLSTLVPSAERRAHVRMLAGQMSTLGRR